MTTPKQPLLAAYCLSLLLLTGCFSELLYRGDGEFTDNGWLNYSRRYVIDLGPVDLSVPGTYDYRLAGLPRATLVVGLQIAEREPTSIGGARPNHPGYVRVQLLTSGGQIVILDESSLNTWVWSHNAIDPESYLYVRGKVEDVAYSDGTTGSRELNVKASGGWGTYFDSERGEDYSLKFEVLQSLEYLDRPANLVIHGWDK